jgi:signal transduction histidine kinase
LRPDGWRLSTTARLALLSTLLVFLSNLAVLGILYGQLRDDALARLRDQVTAQANDLEAAWRDGGQASLLRAIADLRESDDPALVIGAYDAAGRPLAVIGAPRVEREARPFGIAPLGGRLDHRARETAYEVRRLGQLRLFSGRLVDDSQQMQRTLERAVLLSAVLSIALGVLGSLVIIFYVTRRLRVIASVVDAVGAGNLQHRATVVSGGDAFDGLAIRVNTMLDRIQRLLDELRLMTDGFAHDLRSPLARLRAKVERAADEADTPAAATAMEAALVETDLLMRMLTTLLQISRAEALRGRTELPMIAPGSILEELADLYEPLAQEADVALAVRIDGGIAPMALNRELLSQAVSNLIDNALRYGGGAILLRLDRRQAEGRSWAAMSVEDDGPGIPPERHEQALRRFGKLDSARSGPGAGLGLALVEAVARLHGGRLMLDDVAPGLAARILLPVERPDS